ncbi:Pectic acid lyase [Posidoniimonas corsicana]|uniref:Pectic acid lyase n=1 Tax=Posidoniimonas corsicana TaxID=1938618 RepID=A0A5C5VCG1_9BACT|nr:pectate lyase [Posidoniimonas corsicana]TWT35710.1 Pectic acid lyase [Posidoniimonas corsicana]
MIARTSLAVLTVGFGLALAGESRVGAEPVTQQRVAGLESSEQQAWLAYLKRSESLAKQDADALAAEVTAAGIAQAKRAPSGGDFKLSAKLGDPWFASPEAAELVGVVLSYQTPSGGWSKHTGYSHGPREPGMQWTSQNEPGSSAHYLATFDNRSTTEQLNFLAGVWQATGRQECADAFVKGLHYVLAAQYPNGGWPQVYPLEGDYHDSITFNDDAMTHVLELLHGVASSEPSYAFVTEADRQAAAAALERGFNCVRAMQINVEGQRTAWCAQHDALTLQPVAARAMEPATLASVESARLLKFLMGVPAPSPELQEVIEGGLAWLDRVQVTDVVKTKRDGKTVYVKDPASTDVYWARFYRLENSEPVFPGRDGVLYATFEEMAANNRLGYDFYSTIPGSIVKNGQKKWRKMLAKQAPR